MKKRAFILFMLCLFIVGCAEKENKESADSGIKIEKTVPVIESETEKKDITKEAGSDEITMKIPTKEMVLQTREKCLKGMSEEEIIRITENIKVANLVMENAYFYDKLFERLADPNDLYWNYVDYKGDILIGYAFEEGKEYKESSEMTYEAYAKKYGEPVMTYNRFDAENFITLMEEMRDSLKSDLLKSDFNNLISNMKNAKETHDVKYMEEIYYILHDMDYYLLRYAADDIAPYVRDKSTLGKYYDVLEVYN